MDTFVFKLMVKELVAQIRYDVALLSYPEYNLQRTIKGTHRGEYETYFGKIYMKSDGNVQQYGDRPNNVRGHTSVKLDKC